ncbi:MAG: alpha/beta hydrolase-fold protein [Polyangiales bacterium]
MLQGYAIYLPPDYDPSRTYPLYIALHGGSSNGNLFLGVVLGNNMDWLRYDEFVYDDFTPRWTPDWIVVAPTGFGQILWRWMGEQDVLDVIADVQKHYAVDEDRVVLGGLSNGGLGAHAIGTRHASRFGGASDGRGAELDAIPRRHGAPSRGRAHRGAPLQRPASAREHLGQRLPLLPRAQRPGPMRPRWLSKSLDAGGRPLGAPVRGTWYDAGHDILYLVHRHGRTGAFAEERRDRSPREVRVVSGDHRASRQHWVDHALRHHPEPHRARGRGRRRIARGRDPQRACVRDRRA